jgi:hypothetical protein
MEYVTDKRLIGDDGKPAFGLREKPIEDLNIDDFRHYGRERSSHAQREFLKDFQLKRWQYLGVCDEDLIFGIAIVHLGYMSNAFAYAFDRKEKLLTEFGANRALAAHTEMEGTLLSGRSSFSIPGADIRMENSPRETRLKAGIAGKLDADLSFEHGASSLALVTRVGLDRFNYTNKEAGLRVSGSVRAGGKLFELSGTRPAGVVDFTYGYLARYTFWNWAAGSGLAEDGTCVGFNLVQGVNETGFTENAFWLDGKLVKTDVVDFRYDDLDAKKPWIIRSNDGKVDFLFRPEGERSSKINLGVIASRFRQPFGSFSGTLRHEGREWKLGAVSGFAEEHESKW